MQRKYYSDQFKVFAVKMALSGEKSKVQTAHDLGVSERMLYSWVANFTSKRPKKKQADITEALQERVRTEQACRLDYVIQEARDAWAATRSARREEILQTYAKALQDDFFTGKVWGTEVTDRLRTIAEHLFADNVFGDPRFLGKMLAAMSDERRMWNANMTDKNLQIPPKEKHDDRAQLTDDERITLLRKLFDDAESQNNGRLADTPDGGSETQG